MYRNILIPVNLSVSESSVVEAAVRLVDPASGVVTILHVIEEIEGLDGEEGERFYAGLRDRAEKILEEHGGQLSRLQLEIRQAVLVGKRASTIVGYASDKSCDLIVMGSRPVDPEQPGRGLWATSQKVALLADCPILLVR